MIVRVWVGARCGGVGTERCLSVGGAGARDGGVRRRLFAGVKSLSMWGSRSRRGSPQHRSISLPESMGLGCRSATLSYCDTAAFKLCLSRPPVVGFTCSFRSVFIIIISSIMFHVCNKY